MSNTLPKRSRLIGATMSTLAAITLSIAIPSVAQAKDIAPGQKADIAREIQNIMGRRMFYHSIGRNDLEFALWTKKQTPRWAQNQGCWIGDDFKRSYVEINKIMQRATIKHLSESNPEIKNSDDSWNVGTTALHVLDTPIIEVAADGKSAKGVWYTPGAILSTRDGKKGELTWMWERYGGDYILEDGKWVILHLQVTTDFGNPMGEPLQEQTVSVARIGAESGAPVTMPNGIDLPGPTVHYQIYKEYQPTRVPVLTPRLPEPYKTFKDTFEYADCSGK
jgi:hypothetical protein